MSNKEITIAETDIPSDVKDNFDISRGGGAPPTIEGNGKAVQGEEKPQQTAATESADLAAAEDAGRFKLLIDLNELPPKDGNEFYDVGGVGDTIPGVVP